MATPTTLVLGGTGKTGRRVAERLRDLGLPVRLGSRSARATRREIRYVEVSIEAYAAARMSAQLPPELVTLITYLFTDVLDGRTASVVDGVTRALGRPPRDFADYVRDTAATGVWDVGAAAAQPAVPSVASASEVP